MPTISLTLPVAGTTVTAGLHSANYSALQTLLNGGLDTSNWASGKIFAPSKLMQEGAVDGQTLKWVNAASQWQPSSVGSNKTLISVREILTGTVSYTPTSGTTAMFVECAGAGGSGGSAAVNAGLGASGGGGGAYSAKWCTTFTAGAITVAVGAGGSAPAIGANPGNAGGDTSFDTASANVVAKGGAAGATAANPAVGAAGGVAASGAGDFKMDGGRGNDSFLVSAAAPFTGAGGSAPRGGPGGAAQTVSAASAKTGLAGAFPGGGGSGGGAGNTPAVGAAGGAGANGLIIVWEFA